MSVVATAVALAGAAALLVRRRAGLQVAALVVSAHALAAAATTAADMSVTVALLVQLGVAVLVVGLGLARLLPAGPAVALGTAGVLVVCQVGATTDGRGYLIAGVLVALVAFAVGGYRAAPERTDAALIALGTVGVAVGVPQLLFDLLDGVVAAALGLLVVGAVVITGSVAVLRRGSSTSGR